MAGIGGKNPTSTFNATIAEQVEKLRKANAAPSSGSWWLGLSREQFREHRNAQQNRMSESKFGRDLRSDTTC